MPEDSSKNYIQLRLGEDGLYHARRHYQGGQAVLLTRGSESANYGESVGVPFPEIISKLSRALYDDIDPNKPFVIDESSSPIPEDQKEALMDVACGRAELTRDRNAAMLRIKNASEVLSERD